MPGQIIDLNAPSLQGKLPKRPEDLPHGLVTPPEAVRELVASETTTFPAFLAKQLSLAMPQKAAVGAVHIQTGLEIRSGFLRFQIVGMDQTEYVTPCLFLGDPNRRPAGQPATLPRKLLQPLG